MAQVLCFAAWDFSIGDAVPLQPLLRPACETNTKAETTAFESPTRETCYT
jgi:hypothetical protein